MHPRNRHKDGLDFPALVAASPALTRFVKKNPAGRATIDFADPDSQRALTTALLKQAYGVAHWEIPPGYLVPSIPGRADYIHAAAELLGADPRSARVLDVGVGANCVYPLLGHAEYGWSFVGSDIDAKALAAAQKIIDGNELRDAIELRLQASPTRVLGGVAQLGDQFELVLCNPPFHESAKAAAEATQRKWKNLGRKDKANAGALNFGGQSQELWCPGGEVAFVKRLIEESPLYAKKIRWFTALISKQESVKPLQAALKKVNADETRIIELMQGQKKSRVLAWSFEIAVPTATAEGRKLGSAKGQAGISDDFDAPLDAFAQYTTRHQPK
jgi:23S rRNA (adenine1618-N6)-methyltransferase